ncbi:MAG TPA: phosphatidylserine decarboxylase [Desulfomicrobiaceae bacterium]|nr:phosphatidylserine decarboxylase [Desulfomicrobiaceae bacterium]
MESIEYIDRKTGELLREIVPGERWLKWLYHNPLGRLALHGVVKKRFLSAWYGRRMDTPASRNRIPEFVRSLQIDMSEATRPASGYSTFNEFFIRELKPEARPVDPDPGAVVSPADGKVLAFEGLQGLDRFFVKGQSFSLDRFLQDRTLSARYEGGTLLIIRLAPVDYHRFHFPADGRISGSTPVGGTYYSVSPHAVKNRLSVYWENKREYSVLRTQQAGDILLCEVGATMVGAIAQNYEPETEVAKGQEKGWFTFGGSTVIMLLEKGTVRVDADLLKNTRKGLETGIRMGERVATTI